MKCSVTVTIITGMSVNRRAVDELYCTVLYCTVLYLTTGTGWSMILVIALAVLILAAALCYAAVFCWVRARRINRERSVVGPLYTCQN